jgi:prepilin-type N-terminal cleavage/methylation domain-containing protein
MLKRSISQSNQGFTLIETLIAISIVGIIAAIAAPSFSAWYNKTKISNTLTQVEGALKEAQSVALRRNRKCIVRVTEQKVTAIKVDPVTNVETADLACLPLGERNFSQADNQNKNLFLKGTGGSTGTTISFSPRGSTPYTQTTEAIVVYQSDNSSGGAMQCIVVSAGIGIIRTGNYTDTAPPTLADLPPYPNAADPSNPTAEELQAQSAWETLKTTRESQIQTITNKCVTPS